MRCWSPDAIRAIATTPPATITPGAAGFCSANCSTCSVSTCERIHFTWISAAEGKKFQQVVTDITEKTRKLGPYTELYAAAPVKELPQPPPKTSQFQTFAAESELRAEARKLLAEGTVKVVIGYGEHGPLLVTRPEDADRLVWNTGCTANLAMYLKRKEVKALGRPAIVVKACDERSLVVLEKESQFERKDLHVIGMACEGMQQPRCGRCTVRTPRFADTTIGQIGDQPAESKPGKLDDGAGDAARRAHGILGR